MTGAEVPKPHLTREHLLELLHQMVRIRRFEEKCAELYQSEKIRGFLHLYSGEEAVAVGAMRVLDAGDAIVSTYREHGHALARGISMSSVMAELYGKMEGTSRGRGGSMHIFDAEKQFYGGYAIVGGGLPLAAGLALADRMQGRSTLTACFFGEGAVAEGEFHETLNLAALWQLPVLFICENNFYAMGTALERSESQPDIRAKAQAYNIPAEVVDGMDVVAVEVAAGNAATAVREGAGPRFLECRTYRFRAHSMFDPQLYRDKAEVEEHEKHGPIFRLTEWMKGNGFIHPSDLDDIETQVKAEIEEAVQFAESGSWEPVEDLTRHVYGERAEP